jgi:hypothetical protein
MLLCGTASLRLLGWQERLQLLPASFSQAQHANGMRVGRGRKRCLTSPADLMAALGRCLVHAPKARPPQTLPPLFLGLAQHLKQPAQLGYTQLNALAVSCAFFPCARITTSTACASRASVICRYQAVQVRTSY